MICFIIKLKKTENSFILVGHRTFSIHLGTGNHSGLENYNFTLYRIILLYYCQIEQNRLARKFRYLINCVNHQIQVFAYWEWSNTQVSLIIAV